LRLLNIALVPLAVLLAGPQRAPAQTSSPPPPSQTATATNTATRATGTTTQSAAEQTKDTDSSWLKTVSLMATIVVALTTIIVVSWKGSRWVLFNYLQSGTGPKDLMDIIHHQLDSTAGRAALASYVVAHLETASGRTELQKLILSILGSDEAEEPMKKLVTRLMEVRDKSKEKVQKNIEDLRQAIEEQNKLMLRSTLERKLVAEDLESSEEDLESSALGQYGEDPLVHSEAINDLVLRAAAAVVIQQKAKDKKKEPDAKG
jgi:hypothetical protein